MGRVRGQRAGSPALRGGVPPREGVRFDRAALKRRAVLLGRARERSEAC